MRWILPLLLVTTSAKADDASIRLLEGEIAPHAGILLTETQIDRVMATRLELEETKIRLEGTNRAAEALETELAECRSSSCQEGWWCRNGVLVGVLLGTIGAGLAVWGAVAVLDARN